VKRINVLHPETGDLSGAKACVGSEEDQRPIVLADSISQSS
jgi:hypothetical protein